jgi:hypothetical protein
MISEDLTLTDSNTDKEFDFFIVFSNMLRLHSNSILILSNLLQGTDSEEWLQNAENNINNG